MWEFLGDILSVLVSLGTLAILVAFVVLIFNKIFG